MKRDSRAASAGARLHHLAVITALAPLGAPCAALADWESLKPTTGTVFDKGSNIGGNGTGPETAAYVLYLEAQGAIRQSISHSTSPLGDWTDTLMCPQGRPVTDEALFVLKSDQVIQAWKVLTIAD